MPWHSMPFLTNMQMNSHSGGKSSQWIFWIYNFQEERSQAGRQAWVVPSITLHWKCCWKIYSTFSDLEISSLCSSLPLTPDEKKVTIVPKAKLLIRWSYKSFFITSSEKVPLFLTSRISHTSEMHPGGRDLGWGQGRQMGTPGGGGWRSCWEHFPYGLS